jgi:hypothetical protein
MATAHETGHAKNVALFELFIAACASYGNAYNPSRPDLKLSALKALLANAKAASKELKQAERAYGIATNNRELAFKPLVSLAACVIEYSGNHLTHLTDCGSCLTG